MAALTQGLQGIVATIMLGYHLQTGGTAVHGVGLAGVGEGDIYDYCQIILFKSFIFS